MTLLAAYFTLRQFVAATGRRKSFALCLVWWHNFDFRLLRLLSCCGWLLYAFLLVVSSYGQVDFSTRCTHRLFVCLALSACAWFSARCLSAADVGWTGTFIWFQRLLFIDCQAEITGLSLRWLATL